jgi:hypothetical protein
VERSAARLAHQSWGTGALGGQRKRLGVAAGRLSVRLVEHSVVVAGNLAGTPGDAIRAVFEEAPRQQG